MPEFRDGFMNMGKLLVDVGLLIAKQVSFFVTVLHMLTCT